MYEFWHVIIVPKPWSEIIQDSRILFKKNQHMDGISYFSVIDVLGSVHN